MYPSRSVPHKAISHDEAALELLTTKNHSVINSLTKILLANKNSWDPNQQSRKPQISKKQAVKNMTEKWSKFKLQEIFKKCSLMIFKKITKNIFTVLNFL